MSKKQWEICPAMRRLLETEPNLALREDLHEVLAFGPPRFCTEMGCANATGNPSDAVLCEVLAAEPFARMIPVFSTEPHLEKPLFAGNPIRPDYCTHGEDADCRTCSLVNYGRDCRNNPVAGVDR